MALFPPITHLCGLTSEFLSFFCFNISNLLIRGTADQATDWLAAGEHVSPSWATKTKQFTAFILPAPYVSDFLSACCISIETTLMLVLLVNNTCLNLLAGAPWIGHSLNTNMQVKTNNEQWAGWDPGWWPSTKCLSQHLLVLWCCASQCECVENKDLQSV